MNMLEDIKLVWKKEDLKEIRELRDENLQRISVLLDNTTKLSLRCMAARLHKAGEEAEAVEERRKVGKQRAKRPCSKTTLQANNYHQANGIE